jgi:hypothetical protein
MGGTFGGGPFTDKQNALYHHRMAKRYGDTALAQKYAVEYVMLANDGEGYERVAESLSPVGKLSLLQIKKWVGTLDMAEKRGTLRALQHWADMFTKDYDPSKVIERSLSKADPSVRKALSEATAFQPSKEALMKLLDVKREELSPEIARKVDAKLAGLLFSLHLGVMTRVEIESLQKGGLKHTGMTTPGAQKERIKRELEKIGVK